MMCLTMRGATQLDRDGMQKENLWKSISASLPRPLLFVKKNITNIFNLSSYFLMKYIHTTYFWYYLCEYETVYFSILLKYQC